ncbi:MAG: hypothetical protein ACPHO8_08555, partial [Mariniblastus sp.]
PCPATTGTSPQSVCVAKNPTGYRLWLSAYSQTHQIPADGTTQPAPSPRSQFNGARLDKIRDQ